MVEKQDSEKPKSQPPPEKQDLKFVRNKTSAEVTKKVKEIVSAFKGDVVSTKFPNYIKDELEKEFGKGWNVFAGKHFSGVCRFIDGHFAEFEVGSSIVVVFKSYIPGK